MMDVVSHQFTRLGLQNPGFTNENTAQGPMIVIVTVDFHNDNAACDCDGDECKGDSDDC